MLMRAWALAGSWRHIYAGLNKPVNNGSFSLLIDWYIYLVIEWYKYAKKVNELASSDKRK